MFTIKHTDNGFKILTSMKYHNVMYNRLTIRSKFIYDSILVGATFSSDLVKIHLQQKNVLLSWQSNPSK